MTVTNGDNAIACSKQKGFTQGLLHKAVFFERGEKYKSKYYKNKD